MDLKWYKEINGDTNINKKIILLGTCLGNKSEKEKLPYMDKTNRFYDYFYNCKNGTDEKIKESIKNGKYLIFDVFDEAKNENNERTTKDNEINYDNSNISDFIGFKKYYKDSDTIYFLGLKSFRSFLHIINNIDSKSKSIKEAYKIFKFYILPSSSGLNKDCPKSRDQYLKYIKLATKYKLDDFIKKYKTLKRSTLKELNKLCYN